MKVVVITGSRVFSWDRVKELRDVIQGSDLLIVGEQIGADTLATLTAETLDIPVLRAKANWKLYKGNAGPIRNAILVKHARVYKLGGHDVTCYAFPIGKSSGTRNCIEQMHNAGIPVLISEG